MAPLFTTRRRNGSGRDCEAAGRLSPGLRREPIPPHPPGRENRFVAGMGNNFRKRLDRKRMLC